MKITTKDRIDAMLNSARLKRTEPRRMVLEVLLGAAQPQTADEIVAITGKSGPNRVTVYRILESMVEAGIIHRAFIAEGSQHFEMADKCTEHQCHPHFVCTDCGKTSCMHEVSVSMATSAPAGFVIQRQQVRLQGLCPECNRAEH
jgi:Fur family transcriptional regulator, ferric uptake regulator